MELAKKFEEATSCQSVNINSLSTDKKYPIVRTKRMTSKFGPTILLTIRDSESTTVQTFLPKRYSAVLSDDDMEKISFVESHIHGNIRKIRMLFAKNRNVYDTFHFEGLKKKT